MIIVDGEVIEFEETAAENGLVAVAYSPEADLFRRFAKEGHRLASYESRENRPRVPEPDQ